MPLFLNSTNLATSATSPTSERPPRGTPQTAPHDRALRATPDKNLFAGGPCTPTLGWLVGQLPAYVGSMNR
jgi:hypothetical protein